MWIAYWKSGPDGVGLWRGNVGGGWRIEIRCEQTGTGGTTTANIQYGVSGFHGHCLPNEFLVFSPEIAKEMKESDTYQNSSA